MQQMIAERTPQEAVLTTSPTPTDGTSSVDRAGTIRPRRGLPSSRAAVGGLLVVVAVLGTWFLARGSDEPSTQTYVTARRTLAPDHRITEGDLQDVRLDLPSGQRQQAFEDADELVGSITRGPIGAGEIIQATSVSTKADQASAQFSFAVEQEWAVAGAISVGDRIDVYAAFDEERSERILTNVTVQAISEPGDGSLGDSGRQTITVSGPDAAALGEAVGALRTATLSIVRVTDARPADEPATARAPSTVNPDGRPSGGTSPSTAGSSGSGDD